MGRDQFGVTGLIPQRLHLQAQVVVVSLGWCHNEGECANLCAPDQCVFVARGVEVSVLFCL